MTASPIDNTKWLSGSNYSPHAKLLENRLAYQVLETVYQLIPAGTRGGPALDDPLNTPIELHDYQNWVHERLPKSGLAKALAAGPDFLPDIAEELPSFWRYIGRLTAPRNYRQLTEQVVRNLAWYLGEGAPPVSLPHKLRRAVLPSLLLTTLLMLSFVPTTLSTQPWPVILLTGIAIYFVVFGTVWSLGQENAGRFKTNCAEMYAYLLAAYTEPGPASENQVQSILAEMGRDTDNSFEALIRRARARAGMGDLG